MKWLSLWAAATALLPHLSAAQHNSTKQQTEQILQSDFKPPQVFENVNLVRNVNLEKGYVRETINLVIQNVDKSPQSEYYMPFEHDLIGKVGGFEVRDKKSSQSPPFEVRLAALDLLPSADGTSSETSQYYIITLPTPLAPKEQLTLSVSYSILTSLKPLPESIKQDENQYLTYTFSAYWPSAYTTHKQKTKVKAPSGDIPEYTSTKGLLKTSDPELTGATLTYGAYETKLPPGVTYPVTIRYQFTKPVLVASVLERDIEISHWGGNLATEERYWLRNDGATLSNNFNRVIWATQNFYQRAPSAALKELKVPLRPGSVDAYFVDDVGNVSTSRFRPSEVRESSLELKPRYPVFGGWNYSFKIGWNNPLSSVLRNLKTPANSYILSVPLLEGPKMPEGIQYERLDLRIILPEGSKITNWETSGGSNLPVLQAEESLHKTFMDTVGRTVLKLSSVNVVDDVRDVNVLVTYEYTTAAALRKPLTVVGGLAAIFVVAYLLSLVDTSIGKKRK